MDRLGWSPVVILTVAGLLSIATVPIGFGMGTDCTDNANLGCNVVTHGMTVNALLQALIVAASVIISVRARSRWSQLTIAAVGVALSIIVFTAAMSYAHGYPRVTHPLCNPSGAGRRFGPACP